MTYLIPLLINGSVFFFPALVNLVEHSGSIFLLLFSLIGMGVMAVGSQSLPRNDKLIMACFAGYFLVCLVFLLGHGLFNEAIALKWKLGHEIRMLGVIPIYYAFLRYRPNPGAFWFGISGGAIASGIYAVIYIYIFNGVRATGSYHAIAFGDLSLVLAFMSLTGFTYFRDKHLWLTAIPICAFTAGVAATFLSATRGAIIAVPAMTILLLILAGRHPKAWLLQAATALILITAIGGGYFLPESLMGLRIQQGQRQLTAFLHGTDSPKDAARLKMWSESWEIIKTHSLTGVGHGGYRAAVEKRAENNPKLSRVKSHSSPHNMYLTSMVEYGVAGLIIVLGLFASPLLVFLPAARRQSPDREYGFAGLMLVVAFMHFALTESIFNRSVFIAFYLITTAILLAFCNDRTSKPGHPSTDTP